MRGDTIAMESDLELILRGELGVAFVSGLYRELGAS